MWNKIFKNSQENFRLIPLWWATKNSSESFRMKSKFVSAQLFACLPTKWIIRQNINDDQNNSSTEEICAMEHCRGVRSNKTCLNFTLSAVRSDRIGVAPAVESRHLSRSLPFSVTFFSIGLTSFDRDTLKWPWRALYAAVLHLTPNTESIH